MPKKRDSRGSETDDELDLLIDDAVPAVGETRRIRRSVEYNGVLGPPPDWFPKDAQNAFINARNRLLDKGGLDKGGYDPRELRSLIDKIIEEDEAAISHPEVALNRNTFIATPADRKDMSTLAQLWTVYQLGPEKGLEEHAGKDAASGYKSRTAHKKRADYFEKKEVQEIGRKLWRKDPLLTIAAIERCPEMKVYRRRYKGRHTLRDWLNEIDKRPPRTKPGRPRHS